ESVVTASGSIPLDALPAESGTPARAADRSRPGVDDARDALRHAGAVEALSEHPIARAIAAASRAVSTVPASTGGDARVGADGVVIGSLQAFDFRSAPGGGVEAVVRTAHS